MAEMALFQLGSHGCSSSTSAFPLSEGSDLVECQGCSFMITRCKGGKEVRQVVFRSCSTAEEMSKSHPAPG